MKSVGTHAAILVSMVLTCAGNALGITLQGLVSRNIVDDGEKMLNDPLANVLSVIMNAQARNRRSCTVTPVSALIRKVLSLMNEHGYIGAVSEAKLARGGVLNIELIGTINRCGAIKPRFTVRVRDFEKFEKAYLPAKDFGFIVVSTPQGVMTHVEAKMKSLGGRLVAYFY